MNDPTMSWRCRLDRPEAEGIVVEVLSIATDAPDFVAKRAAGSVVRRRTRLPPPQCHGASSSLRASDASPPSSSAMRCRSATDSTATPSPRKPIPRRTLCRPVAAPRSIPPGA